MAYPNCGNRPRHFFPPLYAVTLPFMGFKKVEALGVGYFFDLLIRNKLPCPPRNPPFIFQIPCMPKPGMLGNKSA